jgi:glycerol-3-phosphate dehydrogenase (NAD(P)+)
VVIGSLSEPTHMRKILILEPGAWGSTLGIILSKKNQVGFWYHNPKLSLELSKSRKNNKLPGIEIPKKISISSDLKNIKKTDLIIVASPSFNFRKTIEKLKYFKNLPPIIGIAKGMEKETLKFPSQIVEEVLGNIPYAHLSGPGFAREIARGKPVKEVIASKNLALLKQLKDLFQVKHRARWSRAKVKKKEPSSLLQISITTDLIGIQLAGAVKNSLAIGISLVEAGMENPEIDKIRPKLINFGLKEMIKIGKVMGGKEKTFLGPAGKGDLILTSTSPFSRNFQFGKKLFSDAQKMRQDIRKRKITVEGFDNTWALYKLGKMYKIDLPMINEIYNVIYRKVSPEKTVRNLVKLTVLD